MYAFDTAALDGFTRARWYHGRLKSKKNKKKRCDNTLHGLDSTRLWHLHTDIKIIFYSWWTEIADSQIIVAFVVLSHDVSPDFYTLNVISPTKASVTPGRSSKLVTLSKQKHIACMSRWYASVRSHKLLISVNEQKLRIVTSFAKWMPRYSCYRRSKLTKGVRRAKTYIQLPCTIRSHGTRSHMLGRKLQMGLSKQK